MSLVLLTKRIEFAAAHRYMRMEWDEAKNRAAFGHCYNPPAHGHNYLLEVTVAGEIDPKTGMVVNLFDLKRVLLDMIEEFDHKNLNLDMPYFKDRIPTSENFAHVLWGKLATEQDIGALHALRLCEDEDLYAEVTAADGREIATVTKRYTFNAIQEGHQGRDWDCFVTIRGRIDPTTGMVTDIGALDRLVQDRIIKPFDRQDLCQVFDSDTVRGEGLTMTIWDRLIGQLAGGTLHNVRLVSNRDLSYDYAG
ncbi:MAG: putative 6-pyruvoyl-tetrahydropterin synthase (Modular protein) [Candidatus Nitrospira kreftii]|uniref:6-carboxy-5,6,7,8-tetrahydropterin synthase n=1 Tax=Candidatus Nitrospira kreftii TaxID=2652173 RepID=A0A7S8FB45_9BACT|nr:MAG: putative 6-pyruvoyl-tetrahydropterin synthase (Modular protein) [Candidatus Nitrospira kreftii]